MLRGRDAEVGAVHALMAQGRDGRGGCLWVEGVEGAGCTALLDEAVEQAAGWTVLRSRAAAAEAQMPYAVLGQLLAPLVAEVAGALPDVQRDALGVAVGTHPADGARVPVPAAVLAALGAAASRRPVLVVVDDVQWCDPESSAALLFAARRAAGMAVVVLLTCHTGGLVPVPQPPQLEDWAALAPALQLGPVPPAHIEAELGAVAPDLDPAVRDRVVTLCAGLPGRLGDLLDAVGALRRQGLDPLTSGPWAGPRTRSRTTAALQDLSGAEQRALLVASVLQDAPVPVALAAVARLDGAAADVEVLEDRGLLSTRDGRAVVDPLVAEVVGHEAPGGERRRVHAACASALSAAGRSAEALRHRALATLGADDDLAAQLAALAARRGLEDPLSAIALYEQAAALSAGPSERDVRLVRAAEVAWAAGHSERAEALLQRLPAELDPAGAAAARHLEALRCLAAGDLGGCQRALEDAAPQLARSEPDQALRALALSTWVARRRGEPVVLSSEAVLALPQPQRALADHLAVLGAPWAQHGPAERARAFDALLGAADEVLFPWGVAPCADVALLLGREADYAAALIHRLERLGSAHAGPLAVEALLGRAGMDLMALRMPEAARALEQAEALVEDGPPMPLLGAVLHGHRAVAAHLAGDRAATRRAAMAVAGSTTGRAAPWFGAGGATWALGDLDRGAGDLAASLERLLAGWPQPGEVPASAATFIAAGEVVDLLVRLDGAREQVEQVLEDVRAWVAATGAPRAAMVLSWAASCASSDVAEKEALLRAAADGDAWPLLAARCRLQLGELLRRERRSVEARGHLQAALDVFSAPGLGIWRERASTELAATGVGRAVKRTLSLDLTSQELRVAREAVRGLTNKQIAQALDISPRTVAHHLESVYLKLGVNDRRQLSGALPDPAARAGGLRAGR